MRNEWGEDQGEGNSEQKAPPLPAPSPLSDGGEGENSAAHWFSDEPSAMSLPRQNRDPQLPCFSSEAGIYFDCSQKTLQDGSYDRLQTMQSVAGQGQF